MPLSKSPVESKTPSGQSASSGFPTKAQKLYLLYMPEFPDFPLSQDAIRQVSDRPGELPQSPEQLVRMMAADRQRQQAGAQAAAPLMQPEAQPVAPLPAPEAQPAAPLPTEAPMSTMKPGGVDY